MSAISGPILPSQWQKLQLFALQLLFTNHYVSFIYCVFSQYDNQMFHVATLYSAEKNKHKNADCKSTKMGLVV